MAVTWLLPIVAAMAQIVDPSPTLCSAELSRAPGWVNLYLDRESEPDWFEMTLREREFEMSWRIGRRLAPRIGVPQLLEFDLSMPERPGPEIEVTLLLDGRRVDRFIHSLPEFSQNGDHGDYRVLISLAQPRAIPNLFGHSRLGAVARLPGAHVVARREIRLPDWASMHRQTGNAMRRAVRHPHDCGPSGPIV